MKVSYPPSKLLKISYLCSKLVFITVLESIKVNKEKKILMKHRTTSDQSDKIFLNQTSKDIYNIR